MNYFQDLQFDPSKKPVSYWKNTSDNAIIRSFIDYSGPSISKKLELLLSGGYTRKAENRYALLCSGRSNFASCDASIQIDLRELERAVQQELERIIAACLEEPVAAADSQVSKDILAVEEKI